MWPPANNTSAAPSPAIISSCIHAGDLQKSIITATQTNQPSTQHHVCVCVCAHVRKCRRGSGTIRLVCVRQAARRRRRTRAVRRRSHKSRMHLVRNGPGGTTRLYGFEKPLSYNRPAAAAVAAPAIVNRVRASAAFAYRLRLMDSLDSLRMICTVYNHKTCTKTKNTNQQQQKNSHCALLCAAIALQPWVPTALGSICVPVSHTHHLYRAHNYSRTTDTHPGMNLHKRARINASNRCRRRRHINFMFDAKSPG